MAGLLKRSQWPRLGPFQGQSDENDPLQSNLRHLMLVSLFAGAWALAELFSGIFG